MAARPFPATRPRFFVLAVVAALVLPVTFSGGELEVRDACAEGACCPEINSFCAGGGTTGFNYYNAYGGCHVLDPGGKQGAVEI